MIQSRTCAEKVARSHVRVVLPFGFKIKYHRGTQKTEPYQDDPVRSFPYSQRLLELVSTMGYYRQCHLAHACALKHRDRLRWISLRGWDHVYYEIFTRAANYHISALESLFFFFPCIREAYIPATFLRGPDQSDLRLRRLTRLYGPSLASISGLLLTATALTDLTLDLISNPAASHSSQGLFLLACLQGTPCLRSLDLTVTRLYDYRDSRSQRPTPKDIVPLTRSHYFGLTVFLNNLMSRLSAPSLQEHQCTRYWQQAGREAAAWYLS
jgi:hypothetical protein